MTAVDQLAERCGIESSLIDVFGKKHTTSSAVKQALLKAMHFDAGTEEQAQQTLAQLDAKESSRPLPPVLVVYANGQPVVVPVTVPQGTEELSWTLAMEDGTRRKGHAFIGELTLLDEHRQEGDGPHHRALHLPPNLDWGYHTLRLDRLQSEMVLIITPGKCWLPDAEKGKRYWGVAASLYLLRSEQNWGIGDFTDLHKFAKLTAAQGADLIGLNPVHAMFLDRPEQASPYSPSDRVLLNVLNIDVEAIPELAKSAAARELIAAEHFRQRLELARRAHYVEYERVAELKLAVLRLLFATFEQEGDSERAWRFEQFHQERRSLLDRACLFQALRAYQSSQTPAQPHSHDWPEKYQNFHSPGVAGFAGKQAAMIRFHLWMQWIADEQLKDAAEAASQMAIGLYRDLAVGADPGGAEVWSHPESVVSGATIGAPPDKFSPSGQNWGLPPLHPLAARDHAYSTFIDLLRSNMRYAGGLRIDHAMALQHLYWIPQGSEARDGAYVRYPMEDLIGILALESQRHQCLVVGEDLGTVPEGFRERMTEANILSYRVLFFEKDETAFLPPESYPYLALSVAGNHDLSTIRGWWQGGDIEVKERLGLFPDGSDQMRKEREQDRQSLLRLLAEQDFTAAGEKIDVEEVAEAIHALLARTHCLIAMAQIDDVTGEEEQVNLPGTSGENPNWRRRVSRTLEELAADPRFLAICGTMAKRSGAVAQYQS